MRRQHRQTESCKPNKTKQNKTTLHFVTLVQLKPPKSMPASKHGQQRENGKNHQKNKKSVNFFLRKPAIFQPLMRGTAKQHGFAHWGPFGHQRCTWPDGADPPHFHMHIGKIGQFFEVWVFRRTNAGSCVDGPCKTAGHLQNTPGTPAIHFLLVAAGSQSALCTCPYSIHV